MSLKLDIITEEKTQSERKILRVHLEKTPSAFWECAFAQSFIDDFGGRLQKFINNRAEWKSILHTEIFKKTRWNFPKHEKFTPNMLKDISEVVVLFSEQFIREANINTTPVQKSLKDDLMQRKNAES